ncbi:MAG TPA: murein L,D-transpeptidase catalytic domain family protein [Chitinophagaceae bacterium]|nr:murein L,D-transpeptidase catalytic domain family protein [Chitinophagaceae bacterium]
MKNQFLTIALSFLFFPPRYIEKGNVSLKTKNTIINHAFITDSKVIYDTLQLSTIGLSEKAFDYAYKGYQRLVKKQRLANPGILVICDFSQSSNKKRLYVLDLANNKVLMTSYVAHGRGSGAEYAMRFSNRSRSHQSSLGFYTTSSTYYGEHGLSLRLQGLEPGFNNLAMRRNIVIHGAAYISDEYLNTNKFMGRSYGCPAVPKDECAEIIDLIKNGSCFFVYHPTKRYLQTSKILNG